MDTILYMKNFFPSHEKYILNNVISVMKNLLQQFSTYLSQGFPESLGYNYYKRVCLHANIDTFILIASAKTSRQHITFLFCDMLLT